MGFEETLAASPVDALIHTYISGPHVDLTSNISLERLQVTAVRN